MTSVNRSHVDRLKVRVTLVNRSHVDRLKVRVTSVNRMTCEYN